MAQYELSDMAMNVITLALRKAPLPREMTDIPAMEIDAQLAKNQKDKLPKKDTGSLKE